MEKETLKVACLPLDTVYTVCIKLAKKIISSGYSPDVIIAVARGGFPPARFLCDFLDVKELQTMQVNYYAGGAEKLKDARVVSKNLSFRTIKNHA